MILVRTNTPPRAKNTIPSVPVITSIRYKVSITKATITLITLSAIPIFFFITTNFIKAKVDLIIIRMCNRNHTET